MGVCLDSSDNREVPNTSYFLDIKINVLGVNCKKVYYFLQSSVKVETVFSFGKSIFVFKICKQSCFPFSL